ncbi:MAG: energy-coupling factor transporter transmembrane protein EcfT [Treponema sp.]|nr:energy-coupling factor transporter transmembrane protein EcfT [Treponema sp.]
MLPNGLEMPGLRKPGYAGKTKTPKGSFFIHRLDPRTKLILTLVFTVLVFLVDSLVVAAGQMLFFVGLAFFARVPFRKIFPHRRFLAFLIVMVVVLQMLFRPTVSYGAAPLVPEWVPIVGGWGTLGLEGLFAGLTIACRVIALAILMPLLIMTTEARLLAFGITRLGANYRVAHVITSTLNLVRSFENEVRLIMDARRLRGVAPRGFLSRLAEYKAIALPLMIKVMRRSVAIGLVMDSRAFGAHKTRTWLLSTKMSFADYAAFAFGAVYSVIVLVANWGMNL